MPETFSANLIQGEGSIIFKNDKCMYYKFLNMYMILYKIPNRYKLYWFFRAKKKIVLDLRRTKSTENLQAPDRSEATEDLGGSGMDLSGKLVIE